MKKSLSDLILSHCYIYNNDDNSMLWYSRFQIDYLRFYVPVEKMLLYGSPFDKVKDNPNYEPTWYNNVYSITDYKTSLWDYVLPNTAPVSVLRWSYVRVKKDGKIQDLVEVCIYWKALALYYAWHLWWLDDFVIRYGWECSRVDLCWDFKHPIPWDKLPLDIYTDLRNSALFPNADNTWFDTIYYGDKHSPFMIRVYNKTADLRKDKNIHSFIYPKWYMDECWRLEIELKGKYSKIATPIEWLTSKKRDFKIEPLTQCKRNNYKTAIYSLINCVDLINYSDGEKIMILENVKELVNSKIKNLYHKKN